MAIPSGKHTKCYSNELSRRTSRTPPAENASEFAGMSNPDLSTSKPILFILKCIAALDEYDIEELAYEISNGTDDVLEEKLREGTETIREVYGSSALFAEVAEEYRRLHSANLHPEIECDLPDFDDPDFFTKLHTDCAPLPDRKRLFVRLWNTFEFEDKRAFLKSVDPHGAFRRIA